MRYVWDAAKDALNRRKHILTLADGIPALEDPNRESWIDDRFEYGEERILTLGLNHHSVLLVVSVEIEKSDNEEEVLVRIISARKATQYETHRYYLGHA